MPFWVTDSTSPVLMGSQCHSMENLCSDLYQYPPATVDSTESCTKWNDTNNEIMPRFKLSSLTFRRTLYSSHATWKKVRRWDGAKLSCIAAREKPNDRSIRALWLKNTWINLLIIFPNWSQTLLRVDSHGSRCFICIEKGRFSDNSAMRSQQVQISGPARSWCQP